jgi:hypothetical protein
VTAAPDRTGGSGGGGSGSSGDHSSGRIDAITKAKNKNKNVIGGGARSLAQRAAYRASTVRTETGTRGRVWCMMCVCVCALCVLCVCALCVCV